MVQLPGGFSPFNAVKQAGSLINPTGGVTNYDVFGNLGQQKSLQPWQAPANNTDYGSAADSFRSAADQAQGGQTLGAYTGGGAGTAEAAQASQDATERAAALLQIDSGIGTANDALGRLDGQLNTGFGNIGRDYQDSYGRLIGQKRIAEGNYKANTTDQLNQYQSARNQANSGARGWMDGAQRQLGANGAGGGSAARYAVPYEAQMMAAKGNTQAQATNNRNIMSLDQNWRKAEDEFTNSENDLNRQREQGTNDLRSRGESQRAELLNTVGTLTGQRQIANGGSYEQALAASQPYTSRIKSILDTIDGLAATPAIRERAVTVGRPDLAGYDFARPGVAPTPMQDPTLGNNPVLAALFGQPQEEQLQYA